MRSPRPQTRLRVTSTYDDESGDRSALTRLLVDAEAGTIDTVLVSNLYRLGRTLDTLPRYMDAFREVGVTIHEATEDTPPRVTPGMFSMLRALADLEDK